MAEGTSRLPGTRVRGSYVLKTGMASFVGDRSVLSGGVVVSSVDVVKIMKLYDLDGCRLWNINYT